MPSHRRRMLPRPRPPPWHLLAQLLLVVSVNAWLSWTNLPEFVGPLFRQPRRRVNRFERQVSSSILEANPTLSIQRQDFDLLVDDDVRIQDRQGRCGDVEPNIYGMPWTSSIDPSYSHDDLFYMPFWKWQMDFMRKNLTNLRMQPTMDRTRQTDLTYVENHKRTKRMITLCFESKEYRLIRLTYLDAGTATQVFTSLWYPRNNVPVLGIDFLQFNNQTRHLTVVDMQPIHSKEEDHAVLYSHKLERIRENFPSLQHRMSSRFYDENQFFSSQMLLGGRGEDGPGYVWKELFPAYKQYVETHVDLVNTAQGNANRNDVDNVLRRHQAYDDYSSVRDPAHGLLAAIFGKEYADPFVYDVLFPLSTRPQTSSSKHESKA